MRKSVQKSDVGYDPVAYLRYEVYLDGLKVQKCVTADEELGVVFVYDYNEEDGTYKMAYDEFGDAYIPLKEVKGKVEIRESETWKTKFSGS